MNKRSLNIVQAVFLLVVAACVHLRATDYLPLQVGNRWVLRNPAVPTPVTIEVVSEQSGTYRIHFSDPWGGNDWELQPRGAKVYMTGFGQNGQVAPLPQDTLFFDFTANQGASWKNTVGTLSVVNTHMAVKGNGSSYPSCIAIKQVSGRSSFLYAFAPGVGFTQFGEGKNAFVLDTAESKLPGSAGATVATIPAAGSGAQPGSTAGVSHGRLLVGITTSTFANEAQTPQNLLNRFQQTVDAGITFISATQKWTEVEAKPGQYNLEGLNFQINYAKKLNVPMSLTFRLIDTVDRVLPGDLMHVRWDDPKLENRVLAVVDAMAQQFGGTVTWFMFGNEIDGYFEKHPGEVQQYANLLAKVKQHVKQKAPNTQLSSTVMFAGLDKLETLLKPLNQQWEFISITYYPIRGNFTMRPPSDVFQDFEKMRTAAAGRKVVLQEIGYPSSSLNDSSQDKQAEFYRNVFQALRQDRDFVAAGNFFLLADLSDKFVKELSGFYGIRNSKVFFAYLQTLGTFDLNGQPKKSWEVFRTQLQQNH